MLLKEYFSLPLFSTSTSCPRSIGSRSVIFHKSLHPMIVYLGQIARDVVQNLVY
jgi:hypothetical protein